MTIAGQVAETGLPVWVRDAQSEQKLKSSDSVTNLDLRTILCVALKVEKKIMGVIYVDSRFIMRTFTEEDLIMFEALSEHAAVAIQKARLYDELLQKARIEQENQELRVLDRKKSDFINMLSHEFRTPLTVIQGYSERLKSGKVADGEQIKGHAVIIHDEAKRLARMVDDLLDIARIKSGKETIARVDSDLVATIEKAANSLKPSAEEKQLRVYLVFAKKPIQMTYDPDKIYQVMVNLIDNAIKYTPEHGTIQILADEIPALEVQGDVFIAGFAQVTVSDTGIGISSADKERVFDEFYRTGTALGSREQGTGLGLSICRGIIQAHGGRIWAESQQGKGSKFIFTLPNYQPITKLGEYKSRV
jgi:signal transduction histidine kinase